MDVFEGRKINLWREFCEKKVSSQEKELDESSSTSSSLDHIKTKQNIFYSFFFFFLLFEGFLTDNLSFICYGYG